MERSARVPYKMNARTGPSAAVLQEKLDEAATERSSKHVFKEFGTPQKIGTLMKARENEMQKLEEENYNLKLMVYNLRKELTQKSEDIRRLSNHHDFYNFDGDGSRRSSRTVDDTTEPLVDRSAITRLETQISKLEQALLDRDKEANEMTRKLDRAIYDAKNQRMLREKIDAENNSLHAEKMMLQQDRETLKSSVKHLTDMNAEITSRLRAAEVKAGGSKKVLNELVEKERERVREADRRTERYREAVALLETSNKRGEARIEELRETHRQFNTELSEEKRLRTALEMELSELKAAYRAEKERAEVENSTKLHTCNNHIGKGPCPDEFRRPPMSRLKDLISHIDPCRTPVDLSHDNLTRWRDTVLQEINESLRMLYCFQRQVEKQRDTFVRDFARRTSIGSSIDGSTLPLSSEDSTRQDDELISRNSHKRAVKQGTCPL